MSGLDLLRVPFPAHQISKLPKPTKQQTDAVKADFKKGIRCKVCGAWHHPDVIHLDYVGHAALTDRLLDADPAWYWEPLAIENGLPVLDSYGGMWIKLTVCGVTRLGYGHPDGKEGGNAIKEVIGDALRNAAMRFGAALDLWHKGDLHSDDEDHKPKPRGGVITQIMETSPELPKMEREYLDELAETLKAMAADGVLMVDVVAKLEGEDLSNDHKIYLWSLLPSSLRSAIKATQLKAQKAA